MKKLALILTMAGAALILVGIALNSFAIQNEAKTKREDSLAKARAAKAEKARERSQYNDEYSMLGDVTE